MIRNAYCRLARRLRTPLGAGRHAVPGASLASACEFDYAFYAHLAACRRRPVRR